MEPAFVHLHLHTEYSISDSVVRIGDLVKTTAAMQMPAIAMTDLTNVFGMVKLYRQAMAAGVKPVIGAEIEVASEDGSEHWPLVLLCMSNQGYKNLSALISRAFMEGQGRDGPIVQFDWLRQYAGDLIALSAGQVGELGSALVSLNDGEEPTRARAILRRYLDLFGDRFYIELQRTGHDGEERYISAATHLASETDTPVVATNNVRFIREDEYDMHEIRVCINQGRVVSDPRRPHDYTPKQYLKTPEEMAALFHDIPSAIRNSVEIAIRCNVEIELGTNYLPDYPVAEGDTVEDVLRRESEAGLARILKNVPEEKWPEYRERLEIELDVILNMGFAGYFMIVADFISWAKENAIPVGPGRGSGAGSIVAYAIKITDLDPIEHELLFERFLNPERVSLPDFDVDFCMEKRDKVIEYVTNKYGVDRVSQIITYGTMAAKAVVRDVGRVLDMPYGFVDQIAKLIPGGPGVSLAKSLEEEALLKARYEEDEEVRDLVDTAIRLEGLTRNVGKHAGGVVISPKVITEFSPLYCEAGTTQKVSQFDKDDLEAVGLVKFDFLGLRTLTIIDWAIQNIERTEGRKIDLAVDVNPFTHPDPAPFELLKEARTTAMFQLESRGMKDIIRKLKPDCFDDMVALVALFRPGPLQSGMVDDFINRKHGLAKIDYPHPSLEAILKPTYGVILYQEQVMQIAQVLSGYTLGAADMLRRAMGKKKPEVMEQQRSIFVAGAEKNGVEAQVAEDIFNLIAKFAGYGFNKSHSAAYALVSYHTAWLKTHFPAQFMAAAMSADMENTDKVVELFADCKEHGIEVLPPDINHCEYQFSPLDRQTMHYGLGAVKGAGRAALENIADERRANGEYTDIYDLCARVDTRKMNRRVLEALIKAGALDCLGQHRAELMANVTPALNAADQQNRAKNMGQTDLFGLSGVAETQKQQVSAEPWSEKERLTAEKETLGMYLTGHPIDAYREDIERLTDSGLADIEESDSLQLLAGLVGSYRVMKTKRGKKMAYLTLMDADASLDVVVFPDLFDANQEKLKKDSLLVIKGQIETDDYAGGFKMVAEQIMEYSEARHAYATLLDITLTSDVSTPLLDKLETLLTEVQSGRCRIRVTVKDPAWRVTMLLDDVWSIAPDDEILKAITHLIGDNQATFQYNRPRETAKIIKFRSRKKGGERAQMDGQTHGS